MSVEALKWVLRKSPYEGTVFTIHMVMANIVNDAHANRLWLSEEDLAAMSRCSTRTVQRAKAQMILDGLLEPIDGTHGPGKVVQYRFLMPSTHDTMSGVQSSTHDTMSGEQATPCPQHTTPCRVFESLSINKNLREPKLNSICKNENSAVDLFGQSIAETQPIATTEKSSRKSEPIVSVQSKPRKERPRDLLFEAIAEVCAIRWTDATESELGELRRSHREIKGANGTPEQVRRKAEIYRRMYPGAALTPSALAKHWSRLEEANIPKTKAQIANEEFERSLGGPASETSSGTFTAESGPGFDPMGVGRDAGSTSGKAQTGVGDGSDAASAAANDSHRGTDGHFPASNGLRVGVPVIISAKASNRTTDAETASAPLSNNHGCPLPAETREPAEPLSVDPAQGGSDESPTDDGPVEADLPRYGDPSDPGCLFPDDPAIDRMLRAWQAEHPSVQRQMQ